MTLSFFMKIRKAPLLFFICLSLTTLSCDNGESDHPVNNLSEFAKEFVSTHMDSYSSMNISNENLFNQVIQNVLNMAMLMMVVWNIGQLWESGKVENRYKLSVFFRPL